MEKKITFKTGEVTINDTSIVYKSNEPFALNTINKNNFAGVHITQEKYLKHGDWNYAFRSAGIGIVLTILCFAIGYGLKSNSGIADAFLWLGIICAQLITFGALILILSFLDALFGSKLSNSLLIKAFGTEITKVILATSTNEHVEFYLDKTEQEKVEQIKEMDNLKR